ncbi:hypothetical protein BD626DRAFT_520050 [Schizophyllum amplum]|uniref:Secreted protein n=1 Tax=Schizophyllum amplum TaxID=97359 RepID=A0A550BUQ7_9AGAR|nr:hypothetical protein BD626DRAFT_520050 [Auriculariopsis ampla]
MRAPPSSRAKPVLASLRLCFLFVRLCFPFVRPRFYPSSISSPCLRPCFASRRPLLRIFCQSAFNYAVHEHPRTSMARPEACPRSTPPPPPRPQPMDGLLHESANSRPSLSAYHLSLGVLPLSASHLPRPPISLGERPPVLSTSHDGLPLAPH